MDFAMLNPSYGHRLSLNDAMCLSTSKIRGKGACVRPACLAQNPAIPKMERLRALH